MVISTTVRVWVRALGNRCRIRVESMENARWLLERLWEQGALEGLGRIETQQTEAGCQFEIPNVSDRALATLETALRHIPEVDLMLSPEDAGKRHE